jgi:hypothetical protein
MYKLTQPNRNGKIDTVQRLSDNIFIPFDPANTDYQNFKAQINADEAQLEDADGNVMSAEEAKAYVATLP